MAELKPFSIILEWDNCQGEISERAEELLKVLRKQCSALRCQNLIEVCVVHDDRGPGSEALLDALSRVIPVEDEVWKVRCIAAPGKRYYELKNAGASQALGEWLVFVDSDVLPEDGWLTNLLETLTDPEVVWVGGTSYVGPRTWMERVFALIWFFPLRTVDGPTRPASKFWANNFATRSQVFRQYPFPLEPENYRGACTRLSQNLLAAGLPIHQNPCARVEHPIPSGLNQMVRRALFQGYDNLRSTPTPPRPLGRVRLAGKMATKRFWSAMQQAARRHREVGLRAPSLAGVALVATGYYALFALGRVWGEMQPSWFIKRL